MTDFREAFEAGLSAYDDAERARNEIFEVFDELAEQISEASHGRIRITREDKIDQRGPLEGWSRRPYSALTAATPEGGQTYKLCEYRLSEKGYPVTLDYNKTHDACHDRESLEVGLQTLLKHPETGGKIKRLLASQGQAENTNARQTAPADSPGTDEDE